MRYYLDTEFDETEDHLVLLSMALRSEDGRELYLVSADFNAVLCNPWVRVNVLPHLDALPANHTGPKDTFAEQVELFLCHDGNPEFWGYYCAYDWVLFCRLWGGMLRMPSRFPKVCYDLKQIADVLLPGIDFKADNPEENPKHNALADARWNQRLHLWIADKASEQASPPWRGVDDTLRRWR